MDRFLSIPWMEAYAAHCSADAALAAALKGFSASIEYGWLDKDYPNIYLTLVNGLPQGISETLPKKAQLRVHASQETWMRIHQRGPSGKKAFKEKRVGRSYQIYRTGRCQSTPMPRYQRNDKFI